MHLTRPLAIFDTEYSSLDRERARLLSLGLVVLLPEPGEEPIRWHGRFNPGEPIDPATIEVHGITDAEAATHPPFSDCIDTITPMLHTSDWGGYQIRGDIEVLQREYRRIGRTLETHGVRLVDGKRLWDLREPRTLLNGYRKFVPEDEQRELTEHDAGDDAEMTRALIVALAAGRTVQQMHDEAFPDLVDLGGKFKRNENGTICFNFGKHDSKPAMMHKDYLAWMLTKDFPPDTENIVRDLLRGKL